MMTSEKYRFLYKYLNARYADTVVLTFGQIEDLLGFALPALAFADATWWTREPVDATDDHSEAWTLANRTARPNLTARHVVFERVA